MKQLPYDQKIIKIIKTMRELLMKQINMANILNIDQSTYSRIEKGELAITPGQLKIIANALQTSHFQILAIADADDDSTFRLTSLSQLFVKYMLMIDGKNAKMDFTEEELEFVITRIREKHAEMILSKTQKDNKF